MLMVLMFLALTKVKVKDIPEMKVSITICYYN